MSAAAIFQQREDLMRLRMLTDEFQNHLKEELQRVSEGRPAGVWHAEYAADLMDKMKALLKQLGIPGKKRYDERIAADVLSRYQAGQKVRAIADATGVSLFTVYRMLRSAGIRIRKTQQHGRTEARLMQNRRLRTG